MEGGVTDDVIYSGIAAFIIEIIAKHGEPAPVLCNKDPFTMKYMTDLTRMFPNGKYLFMIRDGRAVVHSVMSRKVTITGLYPSQQHLANNSFYVIFSVMKSTLDIFLGA